MRVVEVRRETERTREEGWVFKEVEQSRVESSAQERNESIKKGGLLIKRRKRLGDRTEPLGTSLLVGERRALSINNYSNRLIRKKLEINL